MAMFSWGPPEKVVSERAGVSQISASPRKVVSERAGKIIATATPPPPP